MIQTYKNLLGKFDKWIKGKGFRNPINFFDHTTSTGETCVPTPKFDIDYIVEQARQDYKSAMSFINLHEKEIGAMYPNSLFEVKLNIKTRNQCSLTQSQRKQLLKEMEYFLSKETRYVSDSAMVSNFLLGKFGEKCPQPLKQELEDYLYLDNTSFSLMYSMLNYNRPLEEKYKFINNIYSNINNPLEKEKATQYLTELPAYNKIYDDNIIINRLLTS